MDHQKREHRPLSEATFTAASLPHFQDGRRLTPKERLPFFVVPVTVAEQQMEVGRPGILTRFAALALEDTRLDRLSIFYQDGEDLYVHAVRLATELESNHRMAVAWEDLSQQIWDEFLEAQSEDKEK